MNSDLLPHITDIRDLEIVAERRIPRMFFDYLRSGSWREKTLHKNRSDFDDLLLRQQVGRNVEKRILSTRLLGKRVTLPLAFSPVGLTGMMHPEGEILMAQAATELGIPYTLSTMSICSLEDVRSHAPDARLWFQLYVMRDREFVADLIRRAQNNGYDALVLTLDLQILGQRHRDVKNGMTIPPRLTVKNLINLSTKWRWCGHMLQTKRRSFGNLVGHVKGNTDSLSSLSAWTHNQFDLTLNWDQLKWFRDRWNAHLILKGIMTPDDARRAVQAGADAIVVSNHGGRQLDGTESSIAALPKIVEAVGQKVEIYLDGGIDCGQNLLRALSLGANAGMIGRAGVLGLSAYGKAGTIKTVNLIADEFDRSMAMTGYVNAGELDHGVFVYNSLRKFGVVAATRTTSSSLPHSVTATLSTQSKMDSSLSAERSIWPPTSASVEKLRTPTGRPSRMDLSTPPSEGTSPRMPRFNTTRGHILQELSKPGRTFETLTAILHKSISDRSGKVPSPANLRRRAAIEARTLSRTYGLGIQYNSETGQLRFYRANGDPVMPGGSRWHPQNNSQLSPLVSS